MEILFLLFYFYFYFFLEETSIFSFGGGDAEDQKKKKVKNLRYCLMHKRLRASVLEKCQFHFLSQEELCQASFSFEQLEHSTY